MATTAQGNNLSRPLPRPGGAPLRRQRRGRGDLYRNLRLAVRRLPQVMLLLAFLVMGAEVAVGDVVCDRLDLACIFLDGGGRHRRGQFQELESLGRGPGRWATADGFIYFDSNQSLSAMGLVQLAGRLIFLLNGDGRRWEGRPWEIREGSKDFVVIFIFFRVLCDVWLEQLYPYPSSTDLYLYDCL
ncbi:unnamed protein product [Urochloa humidicola]